MWQRIISTSAINKSVWYTATAATTLYYCYQQYHKHPNLTSIIYADPQVVIPTSSPLPSRADLILALQGLNNTTKHKDLAIVDSNVDTTQVFDLLVIGGGATGTGVALDAATRGLKVALVERDDFSAGTSSRSTKLVHGGVRYLEKAFMELDYEQYKLVREALHKRATFLHIAPYLSYQLPIMLPLYKWWHLPYYWLGCKTYDLLAGHEALESSYILSKSKALEAFPMLRTDNLVGALVYYDGAHNDSRMNVALALTAISYGAVVTNHVEVVELIKESPSNSQVPKICGAVCRDTLTNKTFNVKCRGVINATGPFTDAIRKLDNPKCSDIVAPSAGVHIILPNYYSPADMGLLDPKTSDGRVIFFLPWQGGTIAGTTDSPTQVTTTPSATEDEIAWILDEIRRYLSPDVKVRRGDVLAAWSGIRPLVRDPTAASTAGLVRNHMLHVTPSGLLTIAGGKWTTYRSMAQETVDLAIDTFNLHPKLNAKSITTTVPLVGSHKYSKTLFIQLVQHYGLETEISQHLTLSYGDKAWAVAALAHATGKSWPVFGKRLVGNYPYIEAEVRYAVQSEYACTAVDVLARRTRLAFLNALAAANALPKVIEIMAQELKWDSVKCQQEYTDTMLFLSTMGLPASTDMIEYPVPSINTTIPTDTILTQPEYAFNMLRSDQLHSDTYTKRGMLPSVFTSKEVEHVRSVFKNHQVNSTVPQSKLQQVMDEIGWIEKVDASALAHVYATTGVRMKRTVALNDILEVLAGIREFQAAEQASTALQLRVPMFLHKIPTERSGGGV